MNIKDNGVSTIPITFKFKSARLKILSGFIPISVFCFFLYIMIRRDQATFGGIVLVSIVILCLLLAVALNIATLSDVVIDRQGISRSIFGKAWQFIRWDNIKLIKAFQIPEGKDVFLRGYNIFPIIKPRYRLTPCGKMIFTHKIENASKLIELLNWYIVKYDIKVETQETLQGEYIPASRL